MAIGTNVLTLTDWAKRIDPDGKIASIAEMLSQTNEILNDISFIEGNLPIGHRMTLRTTLPDVYFKIINRGVPTSKSTTAQVDEQAGNIIGWSEIDKDEAELNANVNAFRLSEGAAFIQAMNIRFAQTLFYGNPSINVEEFAGLSPRYSQLAGAGNSQNIIDAGGTGSDTFSIWLLNFSPMTTFGFFPKGSRAGLVHDDQGLVTIETTKDGRELRDEVYRDKWQWKAGVAVKDTRYNVRIVNCTTSTGNLSDLMIKAIHTVPDTNTGKFCFAMNRTAINQLDIQRKRDVNQGGMTYVDVDGMPKPHFWGIPIRKMDTLLTTEDALTA